MQSNSISANGTAATATPTTWHIFPCHYNRDGSCSCGSKDCGSPAKHPLPIDGLKAATNDSQRLDKWWSVNPQANIGVATGEINQLVVIDIDADHGGFETLLEIEEQYGRFPETVEARTGSGGLHLYFRYPQGERIGSKNGWMQGIDVKANGGYVLSPPSRNLNGDYRWELGCSPTESEIAEIPPWLLPLLPRQSGESEKPTDGKPTNGHEYTLHGSDYASLLHRARCYVSKAESASEGNRNHAAFNLAGNVYAIDDHGKRLSEADILPLMLTWNERNHPPLSGEELQQCVTSALRNGTPREPKEATTANSAATANPLPPVHPLCFADLRTSYPRLNDPVFDGLIREGETCNVISGSKAGKSWLGYGMALSVVTGSPWLDCFATTRGKVLIVDNDLHKCTLANRIPSVAAAMGIPVGDYESALHVLPLRGNLCSLADLEAGFFSSVNAGDYRLIILDALYRFNIDGVSENDNAAMAAMYNLLDRIAERTKAAVVVIHHASKGDQGGKRVTDVGAGAGAQSRAADCHLVLREHEEPDVAVLDAAVRSFVPVSPMAICWQFPLWLPAGEIDPGRIKGRLARNEERQGERDKEGMEKTIQALREGPATTTALRRRTGFRKERQENLLNLLASRGDVGCREITKRGNTCHEYYLNN